MKVLVAGSTGLAGSAIVRKFSNLGAEVVGVHSAIVDLTQRRRTFEFLQDIRPDVVIDAAAKVGGIGANDTLPVDFLSVNLQIQTNLMDASHQSGVDKFIFLGSSCIYPRDCSQPIKEEYLMTGPLERTNSAYAVAKIAGIELINSYRKQYNRRWISVMPTNLYGPKDNFDLNTSHVLPALVNRFVTAREVGAKVVTLWGIGKPRREFLHVDDLASALLLLLEKYDESQHINVGTGVDMPIAELAKLIAELAGFKGEITWDSSKPDGTPRKVLDVSRISHMGWHPQITLEQGIEEVIRDFVSNRGKGKDS